MGGGIEFTKISCFIEVDTRGLPQRTLAYRATVTTQLYIPSLRLSIETPTSTKSALGKITINFISPTEAIERMKNDSEIATEKVAREKIDVDLGTVYFRTPIKDPNVPYADFDLKNHVFRYQINKTTTEVEFHLKLYYCSRLTEKPSLPYLKFLPCHLLLRIWPVASTKGREFIIHPPTEKIFRCKDWKNISREPKPMYLNFTVNTTEYLGSIVLVIDYSMVNTIMGIIAPHPRAAHSEKVEIVLEYI